MWSIFAHHKSFYETISCHLNNLASTLIGGFRHLSNYLLDSLSSSDILRADTNFISNYLLSGRVLLPSNTICLLVRNFRISCFSQDSWSIPSLWFQKRPCRFSGILHAGASKGFKLQEEILYIFGKRLRERISFLKRICLKNIATIH